MVSFPEIQNNKIKNIGAGNSKKLLPVFFASKTNSACNYFSHAYIKCILLSESED